MVTAHTKLNLDTAPCQEDQDYHFQAFYILNSIASHFVISSVIVITV